MDSHTGSKVLCFWDYITCPVPTNCNPYAVINNIKKDLNDEWNHGEFIVESFGDPEVYPLSVRLLLTRFTRGYERTGTEMMEAMLTSIVPYYPPPATILLISGQSNCFSYALKQLETLTYTIMTVKPRSALEFERDDRWLWRTWEMLSIGLESSSSVPPLIFDRNSLLFVQEMFDYLHRAFNGKRNKATAGPTKGKHTVVIIFRDEGQKAKTINTSVEYASYYKKMGHNPVIVYAESADTRSDVLARDLAGIPWFGIPMERDCLPLDEIQSCIKSCGEIYDLIVVDISIFVGDDDDDESLEALGERVILVSKALEVDFVLFAVQPSDILNVHSGLLCEKGVDDGLIINIDENMTNMERIFLDRFIIKSIPTVFVQRGDKFEAFDVDRFVLLILGACNFKVFVDDYGLGIVNSYCTEVKEKLCSRHSQIAHEEEVFNPLDPNEILMAAYELRRVTINCEACSRFIDAAYPDITTTEHAGKRKLAH